MKVLGINGSHRAGKGTAALLQAALDGAAEQASALEVPVSCELVELSKLDIGFCVGCNRCARNCKASCIDVEHHRIDYSRCVVCMDCIDTCHKNAIALSLIHI